MTKAHQTPSTTTTAPATPKGVRDARTGEFVAVEGLGALKDSGFRIRKGLNLLKPIADQALKAKTTKREFD